MGKHMETIEEEPAEVKVSLASYFRLATWTGLLSTVGGS